MYITIKQIYPNRTQMKYALAPIAICFTRTP